MADSNIDDLFEGDFSDNDSLFGEEPSPSPARSSPLPPLSPLRSCLRNTAVEAAPSPPRSVHFAFPRQPETAGQAPAAKPIFKGLALPPAPRPCQPEPASGDAPAPRPMSTGLALPPRPCGPDFDVPEPPPAPVVPEVAADTAVRAEEAAATKVSAKRKREPEREDSPVRETSPPAPRRRSILNPNPCKFWDRGRTNGSMKRCGRCVSCDEAKEEALRNAPLAPPKRKYTRTGKHTKQAKQEKQQRRNGESSSTDVTLTSSSSDEQDDDVVFLFSAPIPRQMNGVDTPMAESGPLVPARQGGELLQMAESGALIPARQGGELQQMAESGPSGLARQGGELQQMAESGPSGLARQGGEQELSAAEQAALGEAELLAWDPAIEFTILRDMYDQAVLNGEPAEELEKLQRLASGPASERSDFLFSQVLKW